MHPCNGIGLLTYTKIGIRLGQSLMGRKDNIKENKTILNRELDLALSISFHMSDQAKVHTNCANEDSNEALSHISNKYRN